MLQKKKKKKKIAAIGMMTSQIMSIKNLKNYAKNG